MLTATHKCMDWFHTHVQHIINPAQTILITHTLPWCTKMITNYTQMTYHYPSFPILGKTINYCIPSIQTPTFEIVIQYPNKATKCLLTFDSLWGATARVTEFLLAYHRHFRRSTGLWQSRGATVRVTECLLAYYTRFQTSTRLLLSLRSLKWEQKRALAFNSPCGARTVVAKRVLAFDRLWSSNRGCQTYASLQKTLRSSNRGCQTCASRPRVGFRERLQQSMDWLYYSN